MATSDTHDDTNRPAVEVPAPSRRWRGFSLKPPIDPVERWAQQVQVARERGPLKEIQALYDELSWFEVWSKKRQARWKRSRLRGLEKKRIRAGLSSERRKRSTAASIQRSVDSDKRWRLQAEANRERRTNFDARLAELFRTATWSSRALVVVVIIGMSWAAVNVQKNLVPSGDKSDPLFWFSYFIELLVSLPLVVVMKYASTAASWGKKVPHKVIFRCECALLSVTLFLNTGPHLWNKDWLKAGEFAVAPVMVGVVLWLHGRLSAWYSDLFNEVIADENAHRAESGSDAAAGGSAQVMVTEIQPVHTTTIEFGTTTVDHGGFQSPDWEQLDWQRMAETIRAELETKCSTEQIQTILVCKHVRNLSLRRTGREAGGIHHETVKRIVEASAPLVKASP